MIPPALGARVQDAVRPALLGRQGDARGLFAHEVGVSPSMHERVYGRRYAGK
jgi:hypothetical protein